MGMVNNNNNTYYVYSVQKTLMIYKISFESLGDNNIEKQNKNQKFETRMI